MNFVQGPWEDHLSFVSSTATAALVFHIIEAFSVLYFIYQVSAF